MIVWTLLVACCVAGPGCDVTFHVVDVPSSRGTIRSFLRTAPDGSGLESSSPAQSPTTFVRLGGVVPGRYGVALWQDVDQDGRLGPQEPESPLRDAFIDISPSVSATSFRISLTSGKSEGSSVQVRMKGFRNDKGWARVALFSSPVGFPNAPGLAWASGSARIQSRGASLVFQGVPPGEYAVGILHDENENGEMDTSVLGIPKEGHGASNGARGTLGPPKFKDAAISVQGEQSELSVSVDY